MPIINDQNIADDHQQEQILKGVQPRRQGCFKTFKCCRFLGIMGIVITALLYGFSYIEQFQRVTSLAIYKYGMAGLAIFSVVCFIVMFLDKVLFLRKAPFDDWVFEIAQKRLGTDVIFYDAKKIYIQYDRSGKEVDKKDFVSEMSDKSIHFSYYYIKTDIDQGYIIVECKRRAPIPDRASFTPNDDKFWNIIPMGLTINPTTQSISAIGWYLNDQNVNDELYKTIPSTSMLIAGGTGCHKEHTPIMMYDTLIHE